MAKVIGKDRWMLVLTGGVPPSVDADAFRAMVGNSVNVSTALMANVESLAIVSDSQVIEDVVRVLGKPLHLT